MQTALIILYTLLIVQSAFLVIIGLKILAVDKSIDAQQKPPLKLNFMPNKTMRESEEQRKERILLENVEAYDGTSKGQVRI